MNAPKELLQKVKTRSENAMSEQIDHFHNQLHSDITVRLREDGSQQEEKGDWRISKYA